MADLLADLRLRSLAEVCRQLDLGPIEVARLCGLAEVDPPSGWAFDKPTLARITEVGGVDAPWPHDPTPGAMSRVRAILLELVVRGFSGDRPTRIDNTWRGLPRSEQHMLAVAFATLAELGWVILASRPEGEVVAVAADPPEPLQAFLDGREPPEALAETLATLVEDR
ncbi:MAG: hypothetical protein AAGA48_30940 [Myxococcota bacterium]